MIETEISTTNKVIDFEGGPEYSEGATRQLEIFFREVAELFDLRPVESVEDEVAQTAQAFFCLSFDQDGLPIVTSCIANPSDLEPAGSILIHTPIMLAEAEGSRRFATLLHVLSRIDPIHPLPRPKQELVISKPEYTSNSAISSVFLHLPEVTGQAPLLMNEFVNLSGRLSGITAKIYARHRGLQVIQALGQGSSRRKRGRWFIGPEHHPNLFH